MQNEEAAVIRHRFEITVIFHFFSQQPGASIPKVFVPHDTAYFPLPSLFALILFPPTPPARRMGSKYKPES